MSSTEETERADQQRAIRFPTAFTVLALVLLLVWIASFFIPSGSYEIDPETGGPIPGSYRELPSCDTVGEGEQCIDKSLGAQFTRLWTAPPNGLYGIQDEAGEVGADLSGILFGSAQIFLFVLAVGAFVTVTMKTGAIQTGIGRLAMRFRNTGWALIAVLMLAFAVGGTTYGMWEETLGFFALMVPLVLALGYDRLVAAAIIIFGAGTGVLASTVNPFATGVASDAAGISVGDGIVLRVILWVVLVTVAIGYVVLYARRVKAESSRSIVGIPPEDRQTSAVEVTDIPQLTVRQKAVLTVFFLAFAVMIYGFVPWGELMTNLFGSSWPLPTFPTFYFTEASMLFFVMAVVVGLIGSLGEQGTVDAIVEGAADFLSAALIIVLARAVTVVMTNAATTDTILNWTEDAVQGASGGVFGVLALLVNLPIAFLVPSSSGHATLVMPILASLADFAGAPRAMAVTAFQAASGIVNYITPTSAVVMGGLTLVKVRYDHFLRFALPLIGIVLVLTAGLLMVGTVLS